MGREERIVDILMDDDEVVIVDEVVKEQTSEGKKEKNLISEGYYRNAIVEIGSNVKLMVLDIAIAIIALVLAYMILTEIF